MNLQKLFEAQAELDAHINEQHPPQPGEDRLAKKILALLVELGECANEWRGFKFWSNDQEPRTFLSLSEIKSHAGGFMQTNPLIEEYVDCLHFILSIGLELGLDKFHFIKQMTEGNVANQLRFVMSLALEPIPSNDGFERGWFNMLISSFIILGEMLGFTWEQVEEAYFAKHEINHKRQEQGY